MRKLRWQRKFSALLDWFLLSGIVLVAFCSLLKSRLNSVQRRRRRRPSLQQPITVRKPCATCSPPPSCSMRFVNFVHQRGMRSITQSNSTRSPLPVGHSRDTISPSLTSQCWTRCTDVQGVTFLTTPARCVNIVSRHVVVNHRDPMTREVAALWSVCWTRGSLVALCLWGVVTRQPSVLVVMSAAVKWSCGRSKCRSSLTTRALRRHKSSMAFVFFHSFRLSRRM